MFGGVSWQMVVNLNEPEGSQEQADEPFLGENQAYGEDPCCRQSVKKQKESFTIQRGKILSHREIN